MIDRDQRTRQGDPTGQPCPKCGDMVIYNGNFYCDRFGIDCDWVMPQPEPPAIKGVKYGVDLDALEGRCQVGLKEYREYRERRTW